MASFQRIFSSIRSAYNNINPSTLTGAIDIIVVKQEDGTLRCTPFHVRFGKLGVLQNQQNKVYITINGTPVEDLYMQLGEAGEALFIEETLSTDNLAVARHLEPSDSNTFLDPDNALGLSSETASHPQLSIIDCSPQIVNKQLDLASAHEHHEPAPTYAFDPTAAPPVAIDVLHSDTIVPAVHHRRPKRRPTAATRAENTLEQSSDDDDVVGGVRPHVFSNKRRSRARKRDSANVLLERTGSCHSSDEQVNNLLPGLRKRSASESNILFFQLDGDEDEHGEKSQSSTPFVDAHSRINSIDSRQKSLIASAVPVTSVAAHRPTENNEEESYGSSQEDSLRDEEIPMRTTRTLSNPIPIEHPVKTDLLPPVEELNPLITALLSQSAPSATLTENSSSVPIRICQSNDVTGSYYLNEDFLPMAAFPSSLPDRPSSPKSDTEYELDKSSQQSTINSRTRPAWQWKWGELPRQRPSVLGYLWPSSKKTTTTEGIYLDDITSDKCDDRSRYLPQMDYYQYQQRTVKDEDQESGTGNSIPQSPVRDQEAANGLGDVQLSLCGSPSKHSPITDEVFNAHQISYDAFATNPSIINDPRLVVRIEGAFYNWEVAAPLIASSSIYRKQLPTDVVEQLKDKHMPQTKSRSSASGSWWPFSGKKLEMQRECSPSTAAEALALMAKSENVPTILKNQDFLRKNSNDSEQEDNEVQKLTAKMKAPSSTVLKKTMILTSDQLKRLNLKSGMNQIEFSVTTAYQGTTVVEANIFFFDHLTKFVISDIDGTITKSDVFGHLLPLVGKDWSHEGIAEFFKAIQQNGYQFIYLSARAIGQSRITRNFLRNIKQCGYALPDGPLLISPDTLVTALYREVIAKKPEDFKIECLKNIASLFPGKNPFYAGFGNRINDQYAYIAVGIPVTRIFTINPRGEVVRQKLSQVLSTSYKNLHAVVDQVFPPMDSFSASEDYSSFTFWRPESAADDSLEAEMRQHLDEMAKRQKSKRNKGGATTPTAGALPKTTPTTTVTKPSGEKLLTLAQATENTVKKS